MNALFLDDSIERTKKFFDETKDYFDEIYLSATAKDAISILKNETIEIAFLDHDLGGNAFQNSLDEDCGMEVVRWIILYQPKIPTIVVHSWNMPAAKNMVNRLKNAGYNATQIPFGVSYKDILGFDK